MVHRAPSFRTAGLDDQWGLLAGDAVHNTRSALDHLACRLVEHNGHNTTIRTAFPIWKDEPSDQTEKKRFKGNLAGMSAVHKDAIRKLQPYANKGSDLAKNLNTLRALDDLDKHQILVPLGSIINGAHADVPEFKFDRQGHVDYIWNNGAHVAKGVEILRFSPRTDLGAIRDVKSDLPLVPTFGEGWIGLDELRAIRDLVVGIVESFAPDFP